MSTQYEITATDTVKYTVIEYTPAGDENLVRADGSTPRVRADGSSPRVRGD